MHWEVASAALAELLQSQNITGIEIEMLENKRHERGSKFRRIYAKGH
jgi:hypothetical protein